MSPDIDIIAELERRWPDKFTDAELLDLAPRLERYHAHDVVNALEQHKGRSRYRPVWSELNALLLVITKSNSAARPAATKPEPTHAEWLSSQSNESPEAAILLHHRRVCTIGSVAAVDRREGMPPGTGLDLALRQHAGLQSMAIRGVTSGLIAIGADPTWAAGIAQSVIAEPAEFDAALASVRLDGLVLPVVEHRQKPTRAPVFGRIFFRDVAPLVDRGEKHRQAKALHSTPSLETEAANV